MSRERVPDRILRSAPVNKQTALVIAKGERFEPIKKIIQRHWRIAPEMKIFRGPPSENMEGKKFGRFTVVGYFSKGSSGALWVARCACGDYETRTARSIRNPKNRADRCEKCRAVVFLRQQQLFDSPARIRVNLQREADQ